MEQRPTQTGMGQILTRLCELDPDTYRGFRRQGVRALQILALVIRDFWDDNCLLQAAALSFTSILSLVPFLALAFSVLKGLGVQNRLEPMLLQQLAAGSQDIAGRIINYINNTNMASLGAIGLVTLVITVITLLESVEGAFNTIWGVSRTRTLARKFSDYLSVAVSAPLLIFAAMSITTSLESQEVIRWLLTNTYLGDLHLTFVRLLPFISTWLAFIFIYIFIPNTKVRLPSAIVGGLLAGTLWLLAQWGYLHFQVGVARYNAIYGTLALLPFFMVWIYTSWLIILFGVEIVCAHQNIRTFRREVRLSVSHRLKELLALAILEEIAAAFIARAPPWSVGRLAEELDAPVRVVRSLLDELANCGYLVATGGDDPVFLPAREPDQITVQEVLATLRDFGGFCTIIRISREEAVIQGLLTDLDHQTSDHLAGMTLQDLVESIQQAGRASVHHAG